MQVPVSSRSTPSGLTILEALGVLGTCLMLLIVVVPVVLVRMGVLEKSVIETPPVAPMEKTAPIQAAPINLPKVPDAPKLPEQTPAESGAQKPAPAAENPAPASKP